MPRADSFDLNTLTTATPPASFDWDARDRGATTGKVSAHLGDIAGPLERFLHDSESVVGCVAWITSPRFVTALLGKPVALIVNKEWTLRDRDTKPSSVRNRMNLSRLTGGLRRRSFPAPLNQLRVPTADDFIDAVRCVGHIPRSRSANNPLMHHKFVVRLEHGLPVAVWTGSFNFTVNATTSNLENAVEIHDPVIAAAFLAEFARVAAVSEPLNFTAGKAQPSWPARKALLVAPPVVPLVGESAAAAKVPSRQPAAKATAGAPAKPVRRRRATVKKPDAAKPPVKQTKRAPVKAKAPKRRGPVAPA